MSKPKSILVRCIKCGEEKPENDFWKKPKNKCKRCCSIQYARWRKSRLEYNRLRLKKYRKENKERSRETSRKNYANNGHKWKRQASKWRRKNRIRLRERDRIYRQKRRKTNIEYRLQISLRDRIRKAIKSNQKNGSAVMDLGCSIPEFKLYLERRFAPGMSWENYGYGREKWNIDHIKELCTFDLSDRKQFLEAAHYTNMQPLWQPDNLRKNVGIQNRKKTTCEKATKETTLRSYSRET